MPAARRRQVFISLGLAAATFAAFGPVLRAGFVNWDDAANLLANWHYRGLGLAQLKWMATTSFGGCYQPLSWLSYSLDYALWGLNPFGYHLTNLILHAASAVLFYFAARLLFRLGSGETDETRVSIAAAFAALFFAIHPLRVESVAWVTERRDVLSGVFYLAALLFYLRRQLKAALACFLLALLAKASGVMLPAVFLILDVYPLRRLPGNIRDWLLPRCRPVLLEKIPFFILSAAFGALALAGQNAAGALLPLARESFVPRIGQVFFGVAFYPIKTLVPARLSPIYEMPPGFHLPFGEVLASVAAVLALSALFIALRKKWPAGLAAWTCYLVSIAPLSGIFPVGRQFAADRYSYLPCLAWAVLAGAAVLAGLNRLNRSGQKILMAALGVLILGLGRVTWSQTKIWRDSQTLWSRAVAVEPDSDVAHDNLGQALAAQGNAAQASIEYRAALAINPDYAKAHNNLGDALASLGQTARAVAEYRRALEIKPDFAAAHYNLGLALTAQGKMKDAQVQYERAIKDAPDFAAARVNLGNILAKQGKIAQAEALYEQALAIDPGLAAARQNLLYLRRRTLGK